MPDGTSSGMIEDLCIRSVQDHPLWTHVNTFMTNVYSTMNGNAPKNRRKAEIQAYLAGMKEPVPQLGIAAQRHYWGFDQEVFEPLCEFLKELIAR
jgi:hypothetical protein